MRSRPWHSFDSFDAASSSPLISQPEGELRSRVMHTRKLHITLLLTALAAVVLAGCGGSSSTNGVESKSPTGILEAAKKAAEGASSVHVVGSVENAGTLISLDLRIQQGKGAKGTISEGPLSFELIKVADSVYIKGSSAFYSHFAGGEAAKLLQGKWLQAPASSGEFQTLGGLTDIHTLLGTVQGTLAKGDTTTVAGHKVIAVKDTTKGGVLYVATTGKPYPIQIAKNGSGGGKVNFEDWNAAVSISAPSSAVNIEKLKAKS